jgi:hypothetical protein
MRVIRSRRVTWAGQVAHIRQMRNVYKILFRKPEEKRPLGRSKCRQENSIVMDLREIRWEIVDWFHLAQH